MTCSDADNWQREFSFYENNSTESKPKPEALYKSKDMNMHELIVPLGGLGISFIEIKFNSRIAFKLNE